MSIDLISSEDLEAYEAEPDLLFAEMGWVLSNAFTVLRSGAPNTHASWLNDAASWPVPLKKHAT